MKKRVAVSLLSLSASGLIFITQWEGFSPTAYIPVKGDVPTIGFGSTAGVKMGDTVTVPLALERLKRDVENHESAIHQCVRVPLSQDEYDAYTSFAFNIGTNAFCGSTLVKKLNRQDYDGAREELLKWTYSGGRKLKGLERRREAEKDLAAGGS